MRYRHRRIVFAVAAMAVLMATGARAADTVNDVVAVVNGFPISNYDLEQRIALLAVVTGMPPATSQQDRAQVLKGLEDEVLEMQEGAKRKTGVPKTEVVAALQAIIDNRHMTEVQFDAALAASGVSPETLGIYIADRSIWRKLVMVRMTIDGPVGGDTDIDEAMRNYLDQLRRDAVVEMR